MKKMRMRWFMLVGLAASVSSMLWAASQWDGRAQAAAQPDRGPSPRPSLEKMQARPDLRSDAIKPGERLTHALLRMGIGSLDSAIADRLATEAGDLPPGTPVTAELIAPSIAGLSREIAELVIKPRLGITITIRRNGDLLVASARTLPVDSRPLRLHGRVGPDLHASLIAAGALPAEASRFLGALKSRIPLGDIAADDRFDLLVATRSTAAGEVENGPLLYVGLERAGGGYLQLLRWTGDGRTQWVDAAGEPTDPNLPALMQPVDARVTSGFGIRIHPIMRLLRAHRGVDYGAPAGTSVVAAGGGVVISAGGAGGYGNQVRLAHSDGSETSYSHLSAMAVVPSQRLAPGQMLGRVGATGLATGPHLHFELRRNGIAIDPLSTRIAARPLRSAVPPAFARSRLRDLLSVAYRQRRA